MGLIWFIHGFLKCFQGVSSHNISGMGLAPVHLVVPVPRSPHSQLWAEAAEADEG